MNRAHAAAALALAPTAAPLRRVYSAPTPNGLKVPMALDELGIGYELVMLDLDAGDQRQPDFLRINPNGRIPALVETAGGEPVAVFESGAILLHLAESSGRLLPSRPAERAAAISWLFLQVAGLGPAFGQAGWFARQGDPAQALALERFGNEARRLAGLVEQRLQERPWLGGDSYSVADIAHFGWLRQMEYAGLAAADFPAIARWAAAIERRPATRESLRRLGMPPMEAATPAFCALP